MASLCRPLRQLPLLQSRLSTSIGLGLQHRLLHSSPILALRKPSKAVVKPVKAPAAPTRKKQIKDAVREQHQELPKEQLAVPFKTHAPTTEPTTSQNGPVNSPPPTTTPKPSIRAYAPQAKSTLTYEPGGAHAFLRRLAQSPEPIPIYEARKNRAYVLWCVTAWLILMAVALNQFKWYLDTKDSMKLAASVSLFVGSIWACAAMWVFSAPAGLIKRILVMPARNGAVKPTLRFEPFRTLGRFSHQPFEVPVGGAFADRGIFHEVEKMESMRGQRRKPGVMDPFFRAVDTIYHANIKVFSRRASFASVRIPAQNRSWKLDMRDCEVHDGGKTLDQLFLPDEPQQSALVKFLFKRE